MDNDVYFCDEQESIPVGCLPPIYQTYLLRWSPDVSTIKGEGEGSSSEQVSSLRCWPLDVTSIEARAGGPISGGGEGLYSEIQ